MNPVPGTTASCLRFDRETKATASFDLSRLESELAAPDGFSWIDIQGSDVGALNDVIRRAGIDVELARHFDEDEILPRIVERPDCLAFHLYEVEDPALHLETTYELHRLEVERMILVLGQTFVVTYHRGELDVVRSIQAEAAENFRLWGKTQGFISFLFLQKCLYDYANLNLANDNYLDHLEEEVLGGDPERLAAQISVAAGNILTLKKLVASTHIVLMLLATKRSAFVSDEARASYHEMLLNVAAVRAAVDSSRDLLDGILGSLQARATQRTGDVTQVLTIVSAVILPLTLITGIYGMNFDHMPELRVGWAYFAVLGSMVAVAAGLLALFWRLGWLGRKGPGPRRRE